jgi:RNA polymerase sigma-54 factor
MPSEDCRRLDSTLLETIVFARFLSLPLRNYLHLVAKVEASSAFKTLAPYVESTRLPGTDAKSPTLRGQSPESSLLGEVCCHDGEIRFDYYGSACTRKYNFDEKRLSEIALPKTAVAALHHLRLINSRNHLTQAIIEQALRIQSAYLATGNPLTMTAMTQAGMSRLLASQQLPMVPDAGRISRLIRNLSIRTPDGKSIALRCLFPNERKLHRQRLDALIQIEKRLMLDGQLVRPWSDDTLADLLRKNYGSSLSRRGVAAIRHQSGVPDSRRRHKCGDYLSAAQGFSKLFLLNPSNLQACVQNCSGVYEIRATQRVGERDVLDALAVAEITNVIYIGSSIDLRKRLAEHLRGNSDNPLLADFLARGGAKVRFKVVDTEWRQVERTLYQAFCRSFGAPPPCNRMSP